MEIVSNAHEGYIKTMGLFSPALDFTAKRLLQLMHGVFSHLLALKSHKLPLAKQWESGLMGLSRLSALVGSRGVKSIKSKQTMYFLHSS